MNFNDNLLFDFLETLGYNMPTLITLTVGIVLTLANWQRHPSAARWALVGFSWLFIVGIVSIAWRTIGVVMVFPDNPPINSEEALSYVVLSGCEAFGYICFMVALSVVRKPHRPRHFFDDFVEEQEHREISNGL